jgi:subtilisin family serine protease
MDGHTTISSVAAGIAASKGIIVVVSAGNEGSNSWKYITAPADADSVLTVGAIDINGIPATFSSKGPTYDRRVKPDVVAVGKGTVIQNVDNTLAKSNGTSFSAPIISGLVACLWQTCPDKSNMEIIRAIQQYSSQYFMPDSIMGYGIPNFKNAFYALNPSQQPKPGYLSLYPNPFSDQISIEFGAIPEGKTSIFMYDVTGSKLFEKSEGVNKSIPNSIVIKQLATLPRGVYIVKVSSGSITLEGKVLKL